MPDIINHPPHYTHGEIETIDVIEDWRLGYHLGNALKYISRADHKGKRLEDLRKAAWYLAREIEREERTTAERTPVAVLDDPYAMKDVQGQGVDRVFEAFTKKLAQIAPETLPVLATSLPPIALGTRVRIANGDARGAGKVGVIEDWDSLHEILRVACEDGAVLWHPAKFLEVIP